MDPPSAYEYRDTPCLGMQQARCMKQLLHATANTCCRSAALDAIGGVSWVPAVGQNRITAMTEGRNDWCISRQRKWGVPIPVFYDKKGMLPIILLHSIRQHGYSVAAKAAPAVLHLPEHVLAPHSCCPWLYHLRLAMGI